MKDSTAKHHLPAACRRERVRRRTAFLAVCVLGGGLLTVTSAQQTNAPPVVSVAKPLFKQVTEWDEFTGRFIAKQRVEVRARVSGYLESVHFTEGQMVAKNQLLFTIDQRPFEAEAQRARAELLAAMRC